MPKADEQRLDSKGMQDMRVDAFEKDDQQAALQWASNITELKTRCLDKPGTNTDATLESCRVLANESMYMAAKYYQMWESTLSLWNSQNAMQGLLRTQFTIAPNLFSKLTKLKTKFGISCFKEGVSTALKSRYHPVLCVSYLVFVLAFLENLGFGLQFGLARKRNLVV